MKPPYIVKDPHLQLMIRELYDRVGKVEPAIQRVQTEVDGIRSTVETVLTPAGDTIPMQQNLPDTTKVGDATGAGMAIPSSYFLDLRSTYYNTYEMAISADWIVLHDNSTPWKTIGLSSVSEINNINTAGPVAGGRDQAATFTGNTWVYFFIIYNPSIPDISSLSSASPIAPTLPSGYNYFVKTTSTKVTSNVPPSLNNNHYQLGRKHYNKSAAKYNQGPSAANTWEVVSLASQVPPTAVSVFGHFGNGDTLANTQNISVGSTTGATNAIITTLGTRTGSVANNWITEGMFFDIPLINSQEMAWAVSSTSAKYSIWIAGYEDDL